MSRLRCRRPVDVQIMINPCTRVLDVFVQFANDSVNYCREQCALRFQSNVMDHQRKSQRHLSPLGRPHLTAPPQPQRQCRQPELVQQEQPLLQATRHHLVLPPTPLTSEGEQYRRPQGLDHWCPEYRNVAVPPPRIPCTAALAVAIAKYASVSPLSTRSSPSSSNSIHGRDVQVRPPLPEAQRQR